MLSSAIIYFPSTDSRCFFTCNAAKFYLKLAFRFAFIRAVLKKYHNGRRKKENKLGAKHIHCCLRTYIAMLRLTEPLLARRFSVGMKTLNTLYLESKVAKRIEDFPAKITREYAIPFAYSPAWYGNEPKPPTPVKPTDEQLRGFDAQSQCLLEESRDKIKAIADKEERRARRIQLRDKLVSIAEQHSFSSGAVSDLLQHELLDAHIILVSGS